MPSNTLPCGHSRGGRALPCAISHMGGSIGTSKGVSSVATHVEPPMQVSGHSKKKRERVFLLESGCLDFEEPNFCGLCAFCNPVCSPVKGN